MCIPRCWIILTETLFSESCCLVKIPVIPLHSFNYSPPTDCCHLQFSDIWVKGLNYTLLWARTAGDTTGEQWFPLCFFEASLRCTCLPVFRDYTLQCTNCSCSLGSVLPSRWNRNDYSAVMFPCPQQSPVFHLHRKLEGGTGKWHYSQVQHIH